MLFGSCDPLVACTLDSIDAHNQAASKAQIYKNISQSLCQSNASYLNSCIDDSYPILKPGKCCYSYEILLLIPHDLVFHPTDDYKVIKPESKNCTDIPSGTVKCETLIL